MTRSCRWSSPWTDFHGQFSHGLNVSTCFALQFKPLTRCAFVFQRRPVSQTGQRWLLIAEPRASPDSLQKYYCASHIFITRWLSALGTMSAMCPYHIPWLKVTKHCEQQREPGVGQKLNLTALKQAHWLPLRCFLLWLWCIQLQHLWDAALCPEFFFFFFHVLLIWRVPSRCLFWSDILTKDRPTMGFSFLTFNMEVSFLIDWANKDFLLLL